MRKFIILFWGEEEQHRWCQAQVRRGAATLHVCNMRHDDDDDDDT